MCHKYSWVLYCLRWQIQEIIQSDPQLEDMKSLRKEEWWPDFVRYSIIKAADYINTKLKRVPHVAPATWVLVCFNIYTSMTLSQTLVEHWVPFLILALHCRMANCAFVLHFLFCWYYLSDILIVLILNCHVHLLCGSSKSPISYSPKITLHWLLQSSRKAFDAQHSLASYRAS